MFDNVWINNAKQVVNGKPYVAVMDGDKCVHFGRRPVDFNFSQRVYNKMVEMGYQPVTDSGKTTFTR